MLYTFLLTVSLSAGAYHVTGSALAGLAVVLVLLLLSAADMVGVAGKRGF